MQKLAFTIALAAALAACNSDVVSAPEDPAPKSSAGPEDSVILVPVDEDERITRCWKNAKSYQCLAASHFAQPIIFFEAFSASTPRVQSDSSSGYSCQAYVDPNGGLTLIKEFISRGEDTLLTNTVSDYSSSPPPWTKQFVTRFAAENKVQIDQAWFDCQRIAEAVTNGSLQTITTTAIKRDKLFGE